MWVITATAFGLMAWNSGINDNVRLRDVVMHGSDYVCADRAENGMMMGRSWGCPAVPRSESAQIINTIKNGTCFYIYSPGCAICTYVFHSER